MFPCYSGGLALIVAFAWLIWTDERISDSLCSVEIGQKFVTYRHNITYYALSCFFNVFVWFILYSETKAFSFCEFRISSCSIISLIRPAIRVIPKQAKLRVLMSGRYHLRVSIQTICTYFQSKETNKLLILFSMHAA